MKFAISICATKLYTHAMPEQARRIQQCVAQARLENCEGHVILSGDNSPELKAVVDTYKSLMPKGWQIHHIKSVTDNPDAERPHKQQKKETEVEKQTRNQKAYRRIADMREAAHALAVKLEVDFCWSLDSDVLPPANALRTSFDALKWDDQYYAIAFCPYPNTAWLGGLGEPGKPMAENIFPHERLLPDHFRVALEKHELAFKTQPTLANRKRLDSFHRAAKKFPPDGNIFQITAKHGWRRRGWYDYAYPGIGLGAMVPTDWCGFGCTLMSRVALSMADFSGYQGAGTEDIFVITHHWQPAGLRIALLPHCPCTHVYLDQKDDKTVRTYLRGYHEVAGEYRGHLRIEARPVP